MSLLAIILIFILLCGGIGTYPAWPHSREYSYYPSGGFGLLIIVLLILALTGYI